MTQGLVVHSPTNLIAGKSDGIPMLVSQAGEQGLRRFVEFFTVTIRNANTRKVYHFNACKFLDWCGERGVNQLDQIEPIHVAGYIEGLQNSLSVPSIKQHLAAIRMLFDWLVTGQIIPTNPATSVKGPSYSVTTGKTPVLTAEETRELLDSIDTSSVVGLRDRAIIALMVWTFARVSALLKMKIEDYYPQQKRWWVRLHEKGGKRHEMPAHHLLEEYLDAYIAEAGIADDKKGFLFRSAVKRTKQLSDRPLHQQDVHRLIRKRAKGAGIETVICCHSFRATGITAYLMAGGTLEKAKFMANHVSTRTTSLYDRRKDEVTLDEVERIVI